MSSGVRLTRRGRIVVWLLVAIAVVIVARFVQADVEACLARGVSFEICRW
jgi:t-SNARE complex subunit (syntaxin)